MGQVAVYRGRTERPLSRLRQLGEQVFVPKARLDGSPLDRLRSPRFWTFAVMATTLAALVFWPPNYWIGVAAAVALPVTMARHPAALVVLMALIAQEVVPRPGVGFVTTLGQQSIYLGKVPLLLILAIIAALVALVRLWPVSGHDIGAPTKIIFGIVAALVLLAIVAGLMTGQSLPSAINQNARPFIVCGVGVAIGLSLRALPGEERLTAYFSGITMVGLAGAAGLAVALGLPADARVSPYFIYYDAALPALAAATLLAVAAGDWRYDWKRILLMAACLIILVASFRRAVWVSAAVPFAAVLLLTGRRARTLGRLAFAAAGLLAMLAVTPGLAADVYARLTGMPASHDVQRVMTTKSGGAVASPSQVGGAGGNEPGGAGGNETGGADYKEPEDDPSRVNGDVAAKSTEGHLEDIKVGWHYVTEHPWTGIGPRARQLPGLAAVNSKRVYVHNEWLLDWLRFGPLAPLLVTAFLGVLAFLAVRALLSPDAGAMQRSAALFGLLAPGCLMLFPFLTTSTRWPLVLGLAAGVLGFAGARDGKHRRRIASMEPHPAGGDRTRLAA
jgi:O-Antigen ligase